MSKEQEITTLLQRWSSGDHAALAELTDLLYGELRRLAAIYLRAERQNHTWTPTEVVHELYVRLLGSTSLSLQNRHHFFGVAAHAMRNILVDHARRRRTAKRGGAAQEVPLNEVVIGETCASYDIIDLDLALTALEKIDARKAKAFEMKFFSGLKVGEISSSLGVSIATVSRDVRLAEAWISKQIRAS